MADSSSRPLLVTITSSWSVIEGIDNDDQYHSYEPGTEEDAKGKLDPDQPMDNLERTAY